MSLTYVYVAAGVLSLVVCVFVWSLGRAAHDGDEMTTAVLDRHREDRS